MLEQIYIKVIDIQKYEHQSLLTWIPCQWDKPCFDLLDILEDTLVGPNETLWLPKKIPDQLRTYNIEQKTDHI